MIKLSELKDITLSPMEVLRVIIRQKKIVITSVIIFLLIGLLMGTTSTFMLDNNADGFSAIPFIEIPPIPTENPKSGLLNLRTAVQERKTYIKAISGQVQDVSIKKSLDEYIIKLDEFSKYELDYIEMTSLAEPLILPVERNYRLAYLRSTLIAQEELLQSTLRKLEVLEKIPAPNTENAAYNELMNAVVGIDKIEKSIRDNENELKSLSETTDVQLQYSIQKAVYSLEKAKIDLNELSTEIYEIINTCSQKYGWNIMGGYGFDRSEIGKYTILITPGHNEDSLKSIFAGVITIGILVGLFVGSFLALFYDASKNNAGSIEGES